MSESKISFGLKQQGHIETIEATLQRLGPGMEYNKATWGLVGEEIGWDPFTAALAYFKCLSNNARIQAAAPEMVELLERMIQVNNTATSDNIDALITPLLSEADRLLSRIKNDSDEEVG